MLIEYAPFEGTFDRSQIDVSSLPQEDEGSNEIPHGEEVDAVGPSQEHDGQGEPQGPQQRHPLYYIQPGPGESPCL